MSETPAALRRKINQSGTLKTVVRTMKSMSMASIDQYEQSLKSLEDYYHAVELGMGLILRHCEPGILNPKQGKKNDIPFSGAVVFGSDQGLVGPFNDIVADYVVKFLREDTGKIWVWAIGERVHDRLIAAGLPIKGLFTVPNSVKAITPLITQILQEIEASREKKEIKQVQLFHNRPRSGEGYEPVGQELLSFDERWRQKIVGKAWPSKNLPEILGKTAGTLGAFIREYLFVSLFRACAESLASENASRLAAMQRAEKNIEEMLEELKKTYNRLRQGKIDAELFDVISGFEALAGR
ncbi:MAG: F0F1 ATP synthase subunit gamma [Acidobacteria bacterium]|nr:F0F1 ATP synthase subunit gamma [Acidobacteriota bacterium]